MPFIKKELIKILSCPECESSLYSDSNKHLNCKVCGRSYQVINGIPIMFQKDKLEDFRWRQAQTAERRGLKKSDRQRVIQKRNKKYEKYNSFIQSFIEGRNGSVLEIGAREYSWINFVEKNKKENKKYYSLDPQVNPHNPIFSKNDKIQYVKGIGESLPFKDNSFSIVYILNTLDHCSKPTLVLKEIKRVLHDRGYLILSVHTFSFINSLFRIFKEKISSGDVYHPHSFTRRGIERNLERIGFGVHKEKSFPTKRSEKLRDVWEMSGIKKLDKTIDGRIETPSEDTLMLCRSFANSNSFKN